MSRIGIIRLNDALKTAMRAAPLTEANPIVDLAAAESGYDAISTSHATVKQIVPSDAFLVGIHIWGSSKYRITK